MDWNEVDRYAKSLIKEAGHKIRLSFYQRIQVESKSNVNDLVTNIDQEIEQFFIRHIQSVYPTHQILGEEGFGDQVTSLNGVTWLVDPIDGTTNFVHQKRNFAITVGIYKDGIGMLGYIYDIVRDELYAAKKGGGAFVNDERLPQVGESSVHTAMIGINARWLAPNQHINHKKLLNMIQECRGTRSYGSAALEMAYVISGKLDAYISVRLSPWDIAGGMVIAKEVGALPSSLSGEMPSLLTSNSFILARPKLHEELLSNYIELK